MIENDLQENDISAISPGDDFVFFESKEMIKESVFYQEMLSTFLELKKEVITLKKEVSKNKLRIAQLEKKRDVYGKEVTKRVSSMISLINDYGGVMNSTDIKKFMGLSKDEFYRTLQCAKSENLIELSPNRNDRRSYIIKSKS